LAVCVIILTCFAASGVDALATAEEIAALKALKVAFNLPWTDTNMDNACTSAGSQSTLTGLSCTAVGTDGIHITGLYVLI
jgi:hypothetical protein